MTTDATLLDGTCSFRLMPSDELQEGPSKVSISRVGEAVVLRYTWVHPTDGEQQGVLLVGGTPEEGSVEATLFDTWHQQPGFMQLAGSRDDGRIDVRGTYAGEWGWEIGVRLEDDGSRMTMRNVVPASALADLPPGSPAMSAGPYDVMVAAWEPPTDR